MARTARAGRSTKQAPAEPEPRFYLHSDTATARPPIAVAPRYRHRLPAATYRYDSSLSPALEWDANPAREIAAFLIAAIEDAASLPAPHEFPAPRALKGADGEALIEVAGLADAVAALKRMQTPFLDWAGKAERASFDIPSLPLFVHERLSTKAVIESLRAHQRPVEQASMFGLFADPQRPLTENIRAFEYRDGWVNRLILGDSLVVMNSLLRYEGLGGQVQMIYIDPPYGVKFGSNFQPFVRKRDVANGDDADMTREPEMVQAYRDTWRIGLHSYLTYLRDRLKVARDLLTPSGSVFVQISDENLHHVRELMDEVFGAENFLVTIILKKTGATTPTDPVNDYILWYARNAAQAKPRIKRIYERRRNPEDDPKFNTLVAADGTMARVADLDDGAIGERLANGWRWARVNYPIVSQHYHPERSKPYSFRGRLFSCGQNAQWRFEVPGGMDRLAAKGRLFDGGGDSLGGVMFWDDWPYVTLSNIWDDLKGEEDPRYVVQTAWKAVQRCMLMTTEPGDLVVDPTCGAGSTAYVAEKWGRRWISVDASRVPLALARQRLLTATFRWYRLRDSTGPAGGFIYARHQNRKGEEDGGIVPHFTLRSIANNEPPAEEVLVDRPEIDDAITRVTGPFTVEATLPTPVPLADADADAAPTDQPGDHVARMIEVLRRAPHLALRGNRRVQLRNIRRPARSLSLSAEAMVDGDAAGGALSLPTAIAAADERNTGALPFTAQPVAILFGPADGAVTEKAVLDAAKEANVKGHRALYVIGFAITAQARAAIDAGEAALGLPAIYASASMDLQMGDLLKTQRSSQIFAVCGQPEIAVARLPEDAEDGTPRWQVRLVGFDTFDPVTMKTDHHAGDDVPCWMLDGHYDGMIFHAEQVFFPRTAAWENIRKALRGTHDDAVWEHLRGAVSAPFAAAVGTEIMVKVLDERGNELPASWRLGQ